MRLHDFVAHDLQLVSMRDLFLFAHFVRILRTKVVPLDISNFKQRLLLLLLSIAIFDLLCCLSDDLLARKQLSSSIDKGVPLRFRQVAHILPRLLHQRTLNLLSLLITCLDCPSNLLSLASVVGRS